MLWDLQQGLISSILPWNPNGSHLRIFLVESWHCLCCVLLVSCAMCLLPTILLRFWPCLSLLAFPSVYLDYSSAFRAHTFPSPVLFARSLIYNLLLKIRVSWCLTSCLVLSHFLALCCMWRECEQFVLILNPRSTHIHIIWVPTMCQLPEVQWWTTILPIFTNLTIQQLRQILTLTSNKYIITNYDKYCEKNKVLWNRLRRKAFLRKWHLN